MANPSLQFTINKQWDGRDTGHNDIILRLTSENRDVHIIIDAPFFNNPPGPSAPPGLPFNGLWEYEVVEAFFLSDDNKYLEVEFCPHGQHLVLLLDGVRNAIKKELDLHFTATINGKYWHGEAVLPAEYFPPCVNKFNAYAIHGSGEQRIYESLYPAPEGLYDNPDFHRLQYFQDIDLGKILPENRSSNLSQIWTL